MIVLIVGVSALASYFVVKAIMPNPKENPQSVPTAATISADGLVVDGHIFSSSALDPTVSVTIGNQSGQKPFDLGSD